MAETVNLPAIGPVKKQWVWAGAALTAGIVGYAWWVRGRDGGPTEVELQPEPETGAPRAPTPGGTVDETGGDQITTNQQWSDAVVKALTEVGYEPGFVATALGKYLAQRPLTSDEEDVIRTAWALVGRPPSGNFPITSDPEPPPPAADPSKTKPAAVSGLTGRAITRNTIQLSWNAVPGATGYEIRRTGGSLGTSSIVAWSGTSYTNTRHLKANTLYTFEVRAVNSAGKSAWRSTKVRTEK